MVDAPAAYGSAEDIAARVEARPAAGADNVPLYPQPIDADPMPAFTSIAEALRLARR
ncbi:hypothetical protein KQY30_10960 [Streptomyces sp. GMY02]|uniref:hypothetical protein n=1 Tax=Streptomyces sp. GMY02 TaxID=1333528 RepID=UPI001C2C2C76|nr:hypothetical protein [Streptomyces sp. GMY02]QXE34728.1 hypothetical protein KQY30_10960 [Streptomyces sp. GMY02]